MEYEKLCSRLQEAVPDFFVLHSPPWQKIFLREAKKKNKPHEYLEDDVGILVIRRQSYFGGGGGGRRRTKESMEDCQCQALERTQNRVCATADWLVDGGGGGNGNFGERQQGKETWTECGVVATTMAHGSILLGPF